MQSYYSVTPSFVTRAKDLSSNDKVIYGLLSSLMTKYGYCWAKNQFIADQVGMSIRVVQRSLEHMKALNYIIVEIEDHNYRKIWTADTYANRELIRKNLGEEEIQSKNLYVRQKCQGVCQDCHTPPIYKDIHTKIDKKDKVGINRAELASQAPPPTYPPLKKKKEPAQKKCQPLTKEQTDDLKTKMGEDFDRQYTNLKNHLQECPRSKYHSMTEYEALITWHELNSKSKKSKREKNLAKRKTLLDENAENLKRLYELNPNLSGMLENNREKEQITIKCTGDIIDYAYSDMPIIVYETIVRNGTKLKKPEWFHLHEDGDGKC